MEWGKNMGLKVHIIAPYQSMVPVIKECLPYFDNIAIEYSVGDLKKGAEMAKEEEKKGADIIISRGGTARLIKKAVTIPVIDMHLSGYDLIRSLTLASNIQDKTAVVGFSNITFGAHSIISLLDLPLKVFTINESDEVPSLLLELRNSGYQHILGDVITVNTSQAYGLKGMLLQSGKESVMKSIEEAVFLYNHLDKRNKIMQVLEQFTLKDHANILIVNDQDQIIYERMGDFDTNPLSGENLHLLNTGLTINQYKIHKDFSFEQYHIYVSGYVYSLDEKRYKVYTIEKNTIDLTIEKGVKLHRDIVSEPIPLKSESMQSILKKLKSLYRYNEPVLLVGDKGTGKEFIAQHIHSELAEEGLLVTIDGKEFDESHFDDLLQSNISTIIITNADNLIENRNFSSFLSKCKQHHIRVFIFSQYALQIATIEQLNINQITIPNLTDRKEDIHELSHYFLADYHQKYGTTAMKITDEALQLLESYSYKNNVKSLKSFIKQIALNEKDYVVHKETVEKVMTTVQDETTLSLQGTLKEIETEIIKKVLIEEDNNQTKAAERLGINRATLWRKLKG